MDINFTGSYTDEKQQLETALGELQSKAKFKKENLIVFGCSTSEILGSQIGSATNLEVAMAILPVILEWSEQHGLLVAIQCCEHLNRSLIVETGCVDKYGFEEVSAIPYLKGGGGLSAAAMELFVDPVLVESVLHQAHGGVDIGNTLIGMHLRRVAICVRLGVEKIGRATLNCAQTRPPLIGGERARYRRY